MRKSIILRIVAMLLAFLLASCNSSQTTSKGDNNAKSPGETTGGGSEAITTPANTTCDDTSLSIDQSPAWLTVEQKNALSMLNYLALTTQEIHSSSEECLVLEDIFTSLLNDINPGSVDKDTLAYLENMREVIKNLLNIQTKREQLQYIHNLEMAAAMRSAIPDPISVLSVTESLDWKRLAVGTVFTVVDSYNNYKDAADNAEHNYFLSGWELDTEEENLILQNRGDIFNYMTNIVQEYGSKGNVEELGKLTLNEKAIETFVDICSEENVTLKTERLVSAKKTYQFFGNYWLELANCYFEMEQYEKCLECIAIYDELDIRIFRQDFNIVPLLPKAIVSAQKVYTGEEYIQKALVFANRILENSGSDVWSVRYFAAQTFLDLYAKTQDKAYLERAYKIVKENVTELIDDQVKLNETYLQDVQTVSLTERQEKSLSKDVKKQEQKRIDEHNKALKKTRETELPPLYEPLALNCDLLFALAEELGIDDAEKNTITQFLESESCGVFLSQPVNNKYSFAAETMELDMVFKKGSVTIPVSLLSPTATVRVTVTDGDKTTTFTDFTISKVTRGDGFETFQAVFKSKKMSNYDWTKKSVITVELINEGYCEIGVMQFKVKKIETHLFSDDTVTFERYEPDN